MSKYLYDCCLHQPTIVIVHTHQKTKLWQKLGRKRIWNNKLINQRYRTCDISKSTIWAQYALPFLPSCALGEQKSPIVTVIPATQITLSCQDPNFGEGVVEPNNTFIITKHLLSWVPMRTNDSQLEPFYFLPWKCTSVIFQKNNALSSCFKSEILVISGANIWWSQGAKWKCPRVSIKHPQSHPHSKQVAQMHVYKFLPN